MPNARPTSLPALLSSLALSLLLGAALGLAAPNAHADVYGYIDEAGNAHFAAAAIDGRYRLFMRGDGVFDSDKIRSGAGMPTVKTVDKALMHYMSTHPNLKKYEMMVNRAAAEFQLEPALLKAIMAAESGFNPNAVSPKGAIGLMQIMPATAERYGVQADKKRTLHQKLTDPAINIRLAARYLRDLNDIFPQRPELAVASYNAGEGAVQKYRNQVPPYPETQNYVRVVAQFYQLYAPERTVADGNVDADAPRSVQSAGPGRITMIIPARGNIPAPITVSSGGIDFK